MTLTTSRSSLRRRAVWLVPIVLVGAVGGGVLLSSPASSSPHPTLPVRTAGQLLTAVQASTTVALSGTIVETARLGLPALPGADMTATLSWQSLVTGSHTALVWTDGPQKQRIALTGQLSESDVIHNGRDLWTYTSTTNQVTHSTLPADVAKTTTADKNGYTPATAAAAALKAINPTTKVSVDPTQVVAGRKAYTLVLTPRDHRSTVRRVTIALDSSSSVPLRVQVFGSASRPALESGFTNIHFKTPAASVFAFHAPKGATVAKDPFGTSTHQGGRAHRTAIANGRTVAHGKTSTPAQPSTDRTKVIGSSWTSVVELPGGLPAGTTTGLLNKASKPVGTTGARLITTSLFNVLILKGGRVFVGAVTPTALEAVAAAAR
jgi:outer membrane lipoprotein-sorting protein